MRKGSRRINCVFYFIGKLLEILGPILLIPLICVFISWGQRGDGWKTMAAFVIPAAASFLLGLFLRIRFKHDTLDTTGSMLMCSLGWLIVSAVGALPFVIAIEANYLNAYFEAISGFTTTGITVFSELDSMPRSILIWRALMQWLGGIGILSFFLLVTFQVGGAHHIFGAESHKISSSRPAPGLFSTLRIIWVIYVCFTVLAVVVFILEKMPVFDAVCHALSTLSTGGFSPHDSSIGYYSQSSNSNYRLIEYSVIFFMILGGINFLAHYRILTRDYKALWDNIEIRYWWRLIVVFVSIIIIEHLYKTGELKALFTRNNPITLSEIEHIFRRTLFQVIAILTSTGFETQSIGSDFFGSMAKQLFLAMMVIGGCVGSTAGGFKILRIAILNRLVYREVFKLRVSGRASTGLIIDKKIVPEEEVERVAVMFFAWIVFLLIGGAITAFLSSQGPWKSFSGMCSAVGNTGPCYIPAQDMVGLNPLVKVIFIIGMLAGRLEILPVLLLFSKKSWR